MRRGHGGGCVTLRERLVRGHSSAFLATKSRTRGRRGLSVLEGRGLSLYMELFRAANAYGHLQMVSYSGSRELYGVATLRHTSAYGIVGRAFISIVLSLGDAYGRLGRSSLLFYVFSLLKCSGTAVVLYVGVISSKTFGVHGDHVGSGIDTRLFS